MKTIFTKVITGGILVAFFSISSFGQTSQKTSNPTEKSKAKLDKTKVPKVVTDAFYKEYPVLKYENWYGIPNFDYSSD